MSAEPIRLKIHYKRPESLLGEFTRSVGQKTVALESKKSVPIGTKFIFELRADGVSRSLEVLGEVISVTPAPDGKVLLNIRYGALGRREVLDELLQHILDAHKTEMVRKYPRIPIYLRAEESESSPPYVIRDVSLGGLGMEIEASRLPKQVKVGQPFLCEVWLSTGTLALHGEVRWVFAPKEQAGQAKLVNPRFGVGFGKLGPDTLKHLEKILVLKGLPPPPWKAQVSFGMNAVAGCHD